MDGLIEHVLHDTKAAVTVIVATIGSSLGLILSVVPDEIGKAGILVGIFASYALIRRARAEARKLELEIEILEEERERRSSVRGDGLSTFGRAVESLEVPPDNKPVPD